MKILRDFRAPARYLRSVLVLLIYSNFLQDIKASGDFSYKVSIRTGSGQHDGSDSDFFYAFIGTRGTSPEFKADIEEYDDREIDQLDEWSFTVSQDLGQFKCIRIRIDGGDGWRFYKVDVAINGGPQPTIENINYPKYIDSNGKEELCVSAFDWTDPTPKGTPIYFGLKDEEFSIQLKTDSRVDSGDLVWIRFVDHENNGPGLDISFDNPPTWNVGFCQNGARIPLAIPQSRSKTTVWTITKTVAFMRVFCEGREVFNYNFADSTMITCVTYWATRTTDHIFFESSDTGTDSYRQFRTECEGLPADWTTVKTDTKFPVYNGEKITVSCKEEERYMNTGSEVVTCNTYFYQDLEYEILPHCKLACTGITPSWQHIKSDNFNFPVLQGARLTVKCIRKYVNLGAEEVTCDRGTKYQGQPRCVKLG